MQLERCLEKELNAWRISSNRKPLLVRGARQVGKSSLVEAFGQRYFDNTIVVNFELSPEYKKCFQTLHPQEICNMISVVSQQKITPEKTLLFLDEIQDCPEAIQALRYFKEKMPQLHVIGAGSLLELVLNQADFRMPVGRVSFLYLYPLSFKEFLKMSSPESIQYIERATLQHPVPDAIHAHLLKQLKYYFWLGGMPEVLSDYHETQDLMRSQAIQSSVIETYEKDFGHYRHVADPVYLQRCFRQTPLLIGQQIKYNKIDPDTRSRELKKALHALEDAGIMQRIQATAATGLPLDATLNEKKFKLNFIDVGLAKRFNQLDISLLLDDNLIFQNQGALTEQFVGQELSAYAPSYEKAKLYFWARDADGTAEVDYVVISNGKIYPLEVKSGAAGKLKSLQQFLRIHGGALGVRTSIAPLLMEGNVLSVPLYMISELNRLLSERVRRAFVPFSEP